eukprot:TRINITY_DN103477_c0_g1_i1.p1 TRINITY_DN103477_c0_g1~~TRINITY_DN103477_c0_g1_i1.p1  ORF type:complete len:518 (-),score=123.63 TRINITY_DN103477_c0_g1_i1:32-1585(-)
MMPRSGALDAQYMFEHDVGLWTFGTIQVLRDRQTKQLVTCKTVSKSAVRRQDNVMDKLFQLRKLETSGISSVLEVIEDKSSYYIISEKLPGSDVADWVVRVQEEGCWIQEQTIASYIRQALIAMQHAHSRKITHRDLRPSSLALTSKLPDASVKVCDLGLAAIFDPDCDGLRRNPGPYTAPEFLTGDWRLNPMAADIWSVGAITHALLVGQPPDQSEDTTLASVAAGLMSQRPHQDAWSERSSMSRHFVEQLLSGARARPTAARALQHPWLKGTISLEAEDLAPGSELQQKLVCYMLALILIPMLMEHRDVCKIRELFQKADTDMDQLVGLNYAESILTEFASAKAVVAAMEIVDVRGNGALDLCAVVCASCLAVNFCSKDQCSAAQLSPQMASQFFACFGKGATMQSVRARLQEGRHACITRELEVHAHVDYEEVLEQLAEQDPLTAENLIRSLGQSGGCGTLLRVDEDDDAHQSDGSWSERLGIGSLQQMAVNMFASCGMMNQGSEKLTRLTAVW